MYLKRVLARIYGFTPVVMIAGCSAAAPMPAARTPAIKTEASQAHAIEAPSPATWALWSTARELGWAAGEANNHSDLAVSFHKIVSTFRMGDAVNIHYDWFEGTLYGKIENNTCSGQWVQRGTSGRFLLMLTPDGVAASGWWTDDGDPKVMHAMYLR